MSERELPPEVAEMISQSHVRPVLFVYGDFPGDPVRLWSGLGELQWHGETWYGLGDLLQLGDVTESTDTTSPALSVRLSGIPAALFDPVAAGAFVDRQAEFWLATIDDAGVISDGYLLFQGRMDSDQIEDSGADVAITIRVVSELDDQLQSRVFRYTHEDQQTLWPDADDKGLEFVAALQNVQLDWGK